MILVLSSVWCFLALHSVMADSGLSTATLNQFKHLVSLTMGDKHFCSGSITGDYFVLTAAQCLCGPSNPKSPGDITVWAGTTHKNSGGSSYSVSKIVCHNKYNPTTLANDIALLVLKTPMEYSKGVKFVLLPSKNALIETNLTISGWGSNEGLQFITRRKLSWEACRGIVGKKSLHPITKGNICVYDRQLHGGCIKDAGASAIGDDGNLYGVVSWGPNCGDGPEVLTNMLNYWKWLDKTVGPIYKSIVGA